MRTDKVTVAIYATSIAMLFALGHWVVALFLLGWAIGEGLLK